MGTGTTTGPKNNKSSFLSGPISRLRGAIDAQTPWNVFQGNYARMRKNDVCFTTQWPLDAASFETSQMTSNKKRSKFVICHMAEDQIS
ncbi:hypothetical protein Y032_0070g434 [Ancylostoma ceylanicum]|uniref:Uncharacterized protein n=1 Tax=Ancylostoma ceylanicum TaxID=53326 RepID=A0A016TXA7_9BILA|nr:hypothetical protein Y032_0070g434 [Ancylostoma ceylanicum]